VFSFVFDSSTTPAQAEAFVDQLRLFKIGYSWGGVTSLVVLYTDIERPGPSRNGRLVRLNIGLEEPVDLIEDLAQALAGIAARK